MNIAYRQDRYIEIRGSEICSVSFSHHSGTDNEGHQGLKDRLYRDELPDTN